MAQWEQWSSLFRERIWFRDLLSSTELNAVKDFDQTIRDFRLAMNERLPDFDELWSDERWEVVCSEASLALEAFTKRPYTGPVV